MAERNVLSIIIPLYNEEDNIEQFVQELNSHIEKYTFEVEVIFVDDGSKDNTVQKLTGKKINSAMPSKIVKLSKNFGSHAALRAGIENTTGNYITFLPADLQDPPELPQLLYDELSKGYDIVWAQRNSTKSGLFERLFSSFYAYLMKKFVNPQFPKKGFDVVMFNKKITKLLNDNVESNSSIFLQVLSLGFKQAFITYDKEERKFGKSKWTISKKIKLFIDSFVAFSYSPIRFVTVMGFIMFFIGIFWTIYIVTREFIYGDLASGWPSLISILMIGFGITNISLGIIAEYLWRTLDASRKRPVFIVDSVIDL